MARFLHRQFSAEFRKYAWLLLALSWSAGLLLGAGMYPAADHSYLSLMRTAVTARMSFVGLVSSFLLFYLLSAFAVYFSLPQLMGAICFVKAFLLAFVSCGAADAFGSAGWLARLLMMFGDIFSCGVLYWYAQRHISGQRPFSIAEFFGCGGAIVLLEWLDYAWVAPFFAGIV